MRDLISRGAAIDAVKNANVVILYHDAEPVEEAMEEAIEATKRSITTDIECLPSAQPDIIHCGECKHRDPEDHKCDCGHDILWQLPRDDRWYCADAERRTDD